MREFEFSELSNAPLIVDAIYKGGKSGNAGDDPINRILSGVGNQGGFRIAYKNDMECLEYFKNKCPAYVVLYSSGEEPEWPDFYDNETGVYNYYGDNRSPGHALHDTPKGGNLLLKTVFTLLHGTIHQRSKIPPFFIFHKTGIGRDVRFIGLAAPGSKYTRPDYELVAVWRSKVNVRFQNYEAYFTILDTGSNGISREWIRSLRSGGAEEQAYRPAAWNRFIQMGISGLSPLIAPKMLTVPTRVAQLPNDETGMRTLKVIHDYFKEEPTRFEKFCIELLKLMDSRFELTLTRPWRDGGRDAFGTYAIGNIDNVLKIECALEAKCYNPIKTGVGVKAMSRLISRIKYRQFGIMVTTSYVDSQAYKEVKEDAHPILILSGKDIIDILRSNHREDTINEWLTNFCLLLDS
jgi:hypothetical protein